MAMSIQDPKRLALFGGKAKDGFAAPKPRQDALGNKIPEPEEDLALIEKEIQDLKIAFEQYFLGLDRKAPLRRRDMLAERLRRLRSAIDTKMPVLLRHRFDQAQAKFSAFDRVWTRSMVEIENGTYSRDVFKTKLRQKNRSLPAKPAPEKAPPTAPLPPRPLTDGQLQALFDAYITARRRTQESTDGLTLDGLSKSIVRQVPEIMQKYGCKAVDFKVVIKDNRARLKAIPRQ